MTRELLSEVLGWKNIHIVNTKLDMIVADTEENFSDPDWDEDWKYGINIYELTHLMKEWAWNKHGYEVLSGITDSEPNGSLHTYTAFIVVDPNEHREIYFDADTEHDAVDEACEWILKQREIEL